jgi:CheY-like chemotaxis protein
MATILIVEDESVLAMKMEMDLVNMGHEVVGTANSAEKVFELTEKWNPDIVLMDIALHGEMHGIDAAVKISEQYDSQTPVQSKRPRRQSTLGLYISRLRHTNLRGR